MGTEKLRKQPELQDDGDMVVLDYRYANGEPMGLRGQRSPVGFQHEVTVIYLARRHYGAPRSCDGSKV